MTQPGQSNGPSAPSAATLREVLAWLLRVAELTGIDRSEWPVAFWATNALIQQIAHEEGKSLGEVGDEFRRGQ